MKNTLEACISKALQDNKIIAVPGFGEFSLQESGAAILNNNKLVPPGSVVIFKQNFQQENPKFISEIQEHIVQKDCYSAENQLDKWAEDRIHYWKNMLLSGNLLKLEGLGIFTPSDGNWIFNGERHQKTSPAYFGLEEISLDAKKEAYQDRITHYLLYTFLFIIPIVGLVAILVSQSERIFGNKNLNDFQVISATHRIQDSASIQPKSKKDSLLTPK